MIPSGFITLLFRRIGYCCVSSLYPKVLQKKILEVNVNFQLGLVEGDKVALVDLEGATGPAKVWEVQHTVRGTATLSIGSVVFKSLNYSVEF